MSKNYVVYNNITGEILRTINCPENRIGIQAFGASETYMEGMCNQQLDYIPYPQGDKLIVGKPTMPLAVSGLIVTGVPEGTKVIIQVIGEEWTEFLIGDGEIDLTGSSTGTYKVTLECFPYMPEELEITV
jgi:hypothetical protein